MRTRSLLARRVSAVVGGLALAAGAFGVAGALPATAAGAQAATVAKPAVAKSVSIQATDWIVPLGAKVRYYGKTKGIAKNTLVRVQRLEGRKWVNFPATTRVTSSGSYSVYVKSGRVGKQQFRVVATGVASKAQYLTVTK